MTSVSYDKRGYTYTNSNNPYGDDRQPKGNYWDGTGKGRGRRYTFARNYDDPAVINDCAMMCDQAGFCKSFTVATDPGTDSGNNGGKGITTCYLNLDKSAGWSQPNNASRIKNLRNYDKNGQVTAPVENFTAVFDTGGDHNVDNTATDYCSGRNCCDERSNPGWKWSTVRLIQGARGGGDNSDKCGTWEGSGTPACKNPGIVTSTTNDNGALVNKVRCGYNRFETKWTQDNWTNLGSFGLDANNLEAAKRAHCNGLSFDELNNDVNQCTTVSSFNKNQRLLNLVSDTWWTDPSEISKIGTLCGLIENGNITENLKKKMQLLPTGINWSNQLVNMINGVLLNTLSSSRYGDTLMPIVNSYCASHPNSIECGCINAIKSGISGCTSEDTPNGCSEGYNYKKIIEQTTNATLKATLTSSFKPRCHSAACKIDTVGGASIIKPAPDGVSCGDLKVNVCASKIMAGGNIIDSDVKVACDFPPDNGSTANTTSGGVTSVAGDVTEGSTSILNQKTGGVENKYIAGSTLGMILSCICIVIVLVILGLLLFN